MSNIKGFLKEILITVSLALIISFFLQNFAIEARIIPTGSMLPTIKIDQRILVNKLAYKLGNPKRGDVIVFKPPIPSEDSKDYIKRVIAIGGETVEVRNGILFVNGEAIKESYINEQPNYDFGPVVVPDDGLFVLGDNRNFSFDSHAWEQWLKIDQVRGKAFFTYWPVKDMGLLK